MPQELETLYMTDSKRTPLVQYIHSWPKESEPYLISAAFECLQKHRRLNRAELLIAARAKRYGIS